MNCTDLVGVRELCGITANLESIPRDSFQEKVGMNGRYYTLPVKMLIIIGMALEFQFSWNGEVIGAAEAEYF